MSLDPTRSYGENIHAFVGSVSKIDPNILKGKLKRLTSKQLEFLDKVLDIFHEGQFYDKQSIAYLSKRGGIKNLEKIQHILEGKASQATSNKVSQIAIEQLLGKVKEGKNLHAKLPAAITQISTEQTQNVLKQLSDLLTSSPSTKLNVLKLFNSRPAKGLLNKLQLSILTGDTVSLSKAEGELLRRMSILPNENKPLEMKEQIQLFFLEFMNMRLLAKLENMQDQVASLYGTKIEAHVLEKDKIFSLALELTRAKEIQATYPTPILARQIAATQTKIDEILLQREARQQGYLKIQEQVVSLGEMDAKSALLRQLEDKISREVSSLPKGRTIDEAKAAILGWINESPYRASLLKSQIATIEKDKEFIELSTNLVLLRGVARSIEDARYKLFGELLRAGAITKDGMPNVNTYAMIAHFSSIALDVKGAENNLLTASLDTLKLAEQVALTKAAEGKDLLKQVEDGASTIGELTGKYLEKSAQQITEEVEVLKTRPTDDSLQAWATRTFEAAKYIKTDSALNSELGRQSYFYQNRDPKSLQQWWKPPVDLHMHPSPNDEHFGILDQFGWPAELMLTPFEIISGQGGGPLNAERVTSLQGGILTPPRFADGFTHPNNFIVKRENGDYELYRLDILASKDLHPDGGIGEVGSFNLSFFRVVLDGQSVREKKPLSQSIKEANFSPFLSFKLEELEGMTGGKIDPDGQVPKKVGNFLLQALVDSIPNDNFRESTHSMIESFQKVV